MQRPRASTLAFLGLAFLVTIPAWIVRYPPIEDLPYHLASIRVVHSLHDPAFGLDQDFVLTLGRTQYLLYYLLGSLLAYGFGVVGANVALMCLYLGGTILALRALLLQLKQDPRLTLLAVPLLYNSMFMLGLFPFLLGVPLMFWGLAVSLRYFDDFDWRQGLLLAVLSVALFTTHVAPYMLFGIGFVALFPWQKRNIRDYLKAGVPVLPSMAAAGWWLAFTDAGRITREGMAHAKTLKFTSVGQFATDAYTWLTDNFRDHSDETIFVALLVVAIVGTALALVDRNTARGETRRLALVPVACVYFYVTAGEGYGFIWPLGQRFAILALLTVIPQLRMPTGLPGRVMTALAGLVAIASVANMSSHFVAFQRDEVGDIDGALAAIPPKQKVAALIYDKFSPSANWTPFLHFGSYYQAEKGGVVEFTFAGYPHWPFDFLPDHYPPPGGPARPRWEWTPEQVPVQQELYPYYSYVLTRGRGFRPPPGTYHVRWHGDRWAVWERD